MKNKVIKLLLLLVTIGSYLFYNKERLFMFDQNYFKSQNDILFYKEESEAERNGNYVIIDNNNPSFSEAEKNLSSLEKYSDLDRLSRAGVAMAIVSKETMPTEPRGSIGIIKPSGWHTVKYDNISGKYLYNRCHLIGFQLTGENANEKNLITCTRQMNTSTMLDFENKIAEYVKTTQNRVLYRVTPLFEDDNLLANGVQLEALSLEDDGRGIKFNIFVYNTQEGILINYKNGDSKLK